MLLKDLQSNNKAVQTFKRDFWCIEIGSFGNIKHCSRLASRRCVGWCEAVSAGSVCILGAIGASNRVWKRSTGS